MSDKVRVGVVSFTDPRSAGLASVTEQYNKKCHLELLKVLETKGFEALDRTGPVAVPRAPFRLSP